MCAFSPSRAPSPSAPPPHTQVPWSSIMVLPLDQPTLIEGTLITLVRGAICYPTMIEGTLIALVQGDHPLYDKLIRWVFLSCT